MPEADADSQLIARLMAEGTLFPFIADEAERSELLVRILNIKGRILSLHSLVQDSLVLQACADSVRRLVPPTSKNLRDSLMRRFNGHDSAWEIQVAEDKMKALAYDQDVSDNVLQATMSTAAYLQLWLFAMRHIECLTSTRLAGSYAERRNEAYIFRETPQESNCRLAALAITLGFESSHIRSLGKATTVKANAQAYFVGRRPPARYEYRDTYVDTASRQIVRVLNLRLRHVEELAMPPLAVDDERLAEVTLKRCGLPSWKSHKEDQRYLFLPFIYRQDRLSGKYLTTFAILQDMFFCFFGRSPFPADFLIPWWSRGAEHLEDAIVQDNFVPSPVSLPAHPPGTPRYPGEVTTIDRNDEAHQNSEPPIPTGDAEMTNVGEHPPNQPGTSRNPGGVSTTDRNNEEHENNQPPIPTSDAEMTDVGQHLSNPPRNPAHHSRVSVSERIESALGRAGQKSPLLTNRGPPLAAGFENNTSIAPLGQLALISHNYSAKGILTEWDKYHDPSLAVLYLFETREYCKFQLNHPHLEQHLDRVIGSLENDYYYSGFNNNGLFAADEVFGRIHQTPLILAFQNRDLYRQTKLTFQDYVCTFKASTGKRPGDDEIDNQERRIRRT